MLSQRLEPLDEARRKLRLRGLGSLRAVCRLKGFALHFEIRLHIDFGGLHVYVAKKILHHHERNTGLKEMHRHGVA